VVYYSSYNSISGNNITANSYNGITVDHSSYNGISENNMADNHYGIGLYSSSNNNMIANNIADNLYCGLLLSNASNNIVYHNSFIGNYVQASADSLSIGNAWNDTYPWGGNYWSDYTGVDEKRGPNQDQLGSDGIGDSPYVIGPPTEQDHYPLMKPYGGPSDIGITSITRSKTAVGQGFSLDLSVKAVNYGIFSEAFSITVYANTTIITTFTNIILASRNSTTITFTWNTAGFVKGNYTISAIATPVLGETDLSDNTCTGGSVQITEVGDLGSRVGGTNVFFAFDGAVTSTDLQLFRECFKGTAPSEYVYLADLGSRVNGVNTFFVCDGLVTSADLQLFRQCYNGQGPPDP
jgi:parallel beta-helix repeat protein